MMPTTYNEQAPVPPPSYHRREVQAQARRARALHLNALTLIETLHLLTLCRLAVQLAHRRCPPPLPKGAGGRPRTYREESLVLIALLKTLWRLSYQDVHEWLHSWPALALACGLPLDAEGLPCVPSPSQLCKRWQAAGAPPFETLFVLTVWRAVRCRLVGARDLIIDSAPILAWRRADPDAATGHAPAHHPRSLLLGYRVHTLLCRGSCLPPTWTSEELGKRSSIERFFGRVFLFFRLQRPPYSGWSTIVRQVALTYTASLVVGLAAWQAQRPDLIRSPKRVLAHLWEDS